MTLPRLAVALVAAVVVAGFTVPVRAADNFQATIVIKDHKFDPPSLKVPVGVRVELTVDNQDPTPEEFESHEFNVEKVIPGNTSAKVMINGFAAGTYHYFGEFNEATAQGVLVAE